jgi:hypothetical protein
MILAVYESHRLQGTAELPLKNRKHPLALMTDGRHAKPAPR